MTIKILLGLLFLLLGLLMLATPAWPLGCALFLLGGYSMGGTNCDPDWDYDCKDKEDK